MKLKKKQLQSQALASESISGDPHRFGRKVQKVGDYFHKPRPIAFEKLFLDEDNLAPLIRKTLGYSFDFKCIQTSTWDNKVQSIESSVISDSSLLNEKSYELSSGKLLAICSYLGIIDLHRENLFACEFNGEIVPVPIDVECALWNTKSGIETLLIPSRLASANKSGLSVQFSNQAYSPNNPQNIVDSFIKTSLELLPKLEQLLQTLDDNFKEIPIRVLLRPTKVYKHYLETKSLLSSKPLLSSEKLQLENNDIPYYFIKRSSPEKLFYFVNGNEIEDQPELHFNKLIDLANPSLNELKSSDRLNQIFEITTLQIIKSYLSLFPKSQNTCESFSYKITSDKIYVETDMFRVSGKF